MLLLEIVRGKQGKGTTKTSESDKLLLQVSSSSSSSSAGWRRVAAGGGQAANNVDRMAHQATTSLLSSGISRRNPEDEYELIHKIGSGTYGDVYKVRFRKRESGQERGRDSLSSTFWKKGFLRGIFGRNANTIALPGVDNFRNFNPRGVAIFLDF